jgi:hypothetical protein
MMGDLSVTLKPAFFVEGAEHTCKTVAVNSSIQDGLISKHPGSYQRRKYDGDGE